MEELDNYSKTYVVMEHDVALQFAGFNEDQVVENSKQVLEKSKNDLTSKINELTGGAKNNMLNIINKLKEQINNDLDSEKITDHIYDLTTEFSNFVTNKESIKKRLNSTDNVLSGGNSNELPVKLILYKDDAPILRDGILRKTFNNKIEVESVISLDKISKFNINRDNINVLSRDDNKASDQLNKLLNQH